MKHTLPCIRTGLAALGLSALSTWSLAGPGHDHDHDHDHGQADEPASITGPAQARFESVQAPFELVGELSGRTLTLYIDRLADNSPVADARLTLAVAGQAVPVRRVGDGTFEATLAAEPAHGQHPVRVAVTADTDSAQMNASLTVPDADASALADAPPKAHPGMPRSWWVGAAVLMASAGGWVMWRRQVARRGGAQ